MKIACFPNTYGRFGPNAAIDLLASAGIHWLELPIKNHGMPSFFKEEPVVTNGSTPQSIFALKERIAEAGLKVCTCNITSGNPLEEEVLKRTLTKLTIANQFGAEYVVAGGGELADDDQWPLLIDHMRQIGDYAQKLGIVYCCETHPGTCQNADGMLELVERVNHPSIRLNFDTGNIFYYNEDVELLEEMNKVAPYVAHVHLKDTNGKFKDWHFPALGAAGHVNFAEVLHFLKGIDFTGPCSLELEGIEGEPELTLEQTHERVLASIEHLKSVGWEVE